MALGLGLAVVEFDRGTTATVLVAINLASPKVGAIVLGWLVAAVELLTRGDGARVVLSTVH